MSGGGGKSVRSGSAVNGIRLPPKSSPAAQPAIRPTVSAIARTLEYTGRKWLTETQQTTLWFDLLLELNRSREQSFIVVRIYLFILCTACAVLAAWTWQYMDFMLAEPLKGAFHHDLPTGSTEREDFFLPYTILWPAKRTLFFIALLITTAILSTWAIVSASRNRGVQGVAILICVVAGFFATGVVIGAGTGHYVESLEDVQEMDVPVQSLLMQDCVVKKKGDFAQRTVLVMAGDDPRGRYLWMNPGIVWQYQLDRLELPARLLMKTGRDPQGRWVLLELMPK